MLRLRGHSDENRVITVESGTYRLAKPLVLEPADSGLQIRAAKGATVSVSGATAIHPSWQPYRDGIFQTTVPVGFKTDQLFVNGVWQPLARYPNYDPKAKFFDGVAADCLSPARIKSWSDPTGGYIHALHAYEWGDVHYQITGKDAKGGLTYEGGWQNNRQVGFKKDVMFVEGIFEELDSPGEWFLNSSTHTLYYYPPKGLDLQSAEIEGVSLSNLVKLEGSEAQPVKDVSIEGITFRRVARTFMQNKEPLLRSDWTIYRGGAIHADGTENCIIQDCFFDEVGGNAVFVSNFNRHFKVSKCRIENAGANGVSFVGSPKAVRSPLFEYDQRHKLSEIDLKSGPLTNDYPSDCLVDNCLITRTGRIEKQSAPIEIAMSRRITVRHCSIYDVPRAGINIGDGCWGGHLIEGCDVFDTVKETGDHGSFNSWGRDRYWRLEDVDLNHIADTDHSKLPLLDAFEPNTLLNNRWRCDHGWDVDLDDGSSNYRIIGNLCLHGGLKLREGFYRVCENNIIVDNSFHLHVWFNKSQDVLSKNIVFTPYQIIQVPPPFDERVDNNLLHTERASKAPATALQKQSGRDVHSVLADAMFVDPLHGNYQVKPGSPALTLGFRNFRMDQFGVLDPKLRARAKTPVLPSGIRELASFERDNETVDWLGAKIKNLNGLGEQSAVGLGSETGVLIVEVPAHSIAAKLGLHPLDVILKVGIFPISSRADLTSTWKNLSIGNHEKWIIWRGQRENLMSFQVP